MFTTRGTILMKSFLVALLGSACSETAGLPPGVTVEAVELTPASVVIPAGESQQFAVLATLSDGNTVNVPPAVEYSATGGTISQNGRFVAGEETGEFRVIASYAPEEVADTSTVVITFGGGGSGEATVLFADDFESGNLAHSEGGISWTDNAYVDVTSVIARSGTRSARFRQGIPEGDGNWSELRFGGMPNLTEVFLQFYLYMPIGTEVPSIGPKVTVPYPGANDKFFRLWADNYGQPPEVGASTWSRAGGIGALGREYLYQPDDGPYWNMGQGPAPVPALVPLIIDANKGRWVQIRIRAKVSGPDNSSGVIQMWADGVNVGDDTALHNYPPNGANNYYRNGYLLGWANSGFPPGQMMYIDDFSISVGGFPPS